MMYEMKSGKPEPTLLPTHWIFILPNHIDIAWEQLPFDDIVSCIQQWKSKLTEMTEWGIEPMTFRLGVRHLHHSATEDATVD